VTPRRDRKDVLDGTPYLSIKVLGAGSMGTVYMAEHRMLHTPVCVKLVHADLAADEALVDRFRVEAQSLAVLGGGRHPNLVHVRDFGVTGFGQPFLAMEFLAGETLLDVRKQRGEIPWREACDWVLQALRGVAVAHGSGIVHRDLKPANLFLCRDADGGALVKVLDFGIAKIVSANAPVAPGAVPTATGLMLGTPRYAAPEQITAGRVDARADVYSMALVLFDLVTGKVPYADRKTADQIMVAQVHDRLPAAASIAKQAIPRALDDVLEKASAKDRDERYESAVAFANALEALLATQPSVAPVAVETAPLALPAQRPVSRETVQLSQDEQAAYAKASLVGPADRTEHAAPCFPVDHGMQTSAVPGPGSVTLAEVAQRRRRTTIFIVVTIVSTLLFTALWLGVSRWF
jgi:eukaryotic-like serine/threonine-protein kinase